MSVGNFTLPTRMLRDCTEGMMWCFSDWAYDVTGGMFWTFMLIGFVVVLILATQKLGTSKSFGFGSFVGMISSIWFAILQLIPWWTTTVFIIVGFVGIAVMFLSDK